MVTSYNSKDMTNFANYMLGVDMSKREVKTVQHSDFENWKGDKKSEDIKEHVLYVLRELKAKIETDSVYKDNIYAEIVDLAEKEERDYTKKELKILDTLDNGLSQTQILSEIDKLISRHSLEEYDADFYNQPNRKIIGTQQP